MKQPSLRTAGVGLASVVAAAVIAIQVFQGPAGSRGETADAPVGNVVTFGANLCGVWQPPLPRFEVRQGVASSGDGHLVFDPRDRPDSGDHATLGDALGLAGITISEEHVEGFGDGQSIRTGDLCSDLSRVPGRVTWSVNGAQQVGDPFDFVPQDGDRVTIAFLPEGTEAPPPPELPDTLTPLVTAPPGSDDPANYQSGEPGDNGTVVLTPGDDGTVEVRKP